MTTIFRPLFASLLLVGLFTVPARAEVFELHSGGEVHGTLVNADETPRESYVVKTHFGGQVTLPADQVKKVTHQTAAEARYDQIRSKATDTVEDQWKLAEWCRENRLLNERRNTWSASSSSTPITPTPGTAWAIAGCKAAGSRTTP